MKRSIGPWACALVVVVLASGCPPPCDGPDPRAASITYELVSTMTDTSGIVRISAIVTNNGREPWISGEDQQEATLYEGDVIVASEDFTSLAVGASIEVTYERLWSTQDEFRPPTYELVIAYDPDIYIDGNEQNDDCNLDNNTRIRTTAGLDALFD